MRSILFVFCLLELLQAGSPKAMEFIYLPAGEFVMGCSPGDTQCRDNEKPSHRVRIERPFRLQKYEVTQDQWRDVMGNNPSEHEGGDLPVHNVSWNNIEQYLEKLNNRGDGFHYRLPTEAEWEYAARAGSTEPYPGPINALAWFNDNSQHEPHPGGSKQANAWGLYDMNGNVWEWVSDWFDANYYASNPPAGPVSNPKGPSSGTQRVVRGGSFSDNAAFARVSNRFGGNPAFGNYDLGFRLVQEPTEIQTIN